MSRSPISVTLTNIETGEVMLFKSQTEAAKHTGRSDRFFSRNNGNVVGGELISLVLE